MSRSYTRCSATQDAAEATQFSGSWHFHFCLPAPSSSCLGLPTIHRDHRTLSEQVPCLQRAKHGSKETCHLLQQAGVRDSCRLEGEKKPQWGKNRKEPPRSIDHRTTEQVPCLQRAKHGSKETCNLLQQAGVRVSCRLEREKTQWGRERDANHRATEE